MANTSTPRLKVYRLESNYSEDNDNDIQAMTDDELLPVVPKDLNPFNTEEMVGVRMRQDARMVVESGYYIAEIPLKVEGTYIESDGAVCCEGWVLGKGNIDVFVWRGKASDTILDSPALSDLHTYADSATYPEYATGQGMWMQLDRRFWNYTVDSAKTYVTSGGLSSTKPESGDYEIHDMDWISFKIGNMLKNSNRLFTDGYANYVPLLSSVENGAQSGKIIVRYKKYREFCSPLTFSSVPSGTTYRVPFGDIYNGNLHGRWLHQVAIDGGTEMPSAPLVESGSAKVDYGKKNYYEGNYLYKRKLYPFRVKVLQETGVTSEFNADAELANGRATVPCELSWFMDDIMKPVVFERITVDAGEADERKVFRQLTRKQVTIQYQSSDGDHFVVTLNPSYYGTGSANSYKYPRELFLVYNYVDESLGNAFDFNYDYGDETAVTGFDARTAAIGYGHANNGCFDSVPDSSHVYVTRSIIAMTNAAGRDASKDLPLTLNGTSVSFTIPSSPTISTLDAPVASADFEINADSTSAEAIEKTRLINALAGFAPSKGMTLYVNGNLVCMLSGSSQTLSDQTIDGIDGYTVSFNGTNTITVTHATEISRVSEIMMMYKEECPIGLGYRLPCYEKVKTSTLFVSSYPNWLKGHVNNDLDVFYGNRIYSGTQLQGSTVRNYHDIYPEYVRDGWYAMYAEGAVEFNEEKTENDYFDVMNYTTTVVDDNEIWNYAGKNMMPDYWADSKKLSLEYKKVRYNVAHYDGIFSIVRGRMVNYSNRNNTSRYMMLDEDFPEASGKRWVGKEDSIIRRMIEVGRDEAEKVVHGTVPESETENALGESLSLLSDIEFGEGTNFIATVNTKDDRVATFRLPIGKHVIFSFWSNPTEAKVVPSGEDNGDYVRVHAKIRQATINGDAVDSLALGLESSPVSWDGSDRSSVFVADSAINWVYLPDTEDVLKGQVAGDIYEGGDIGTLQTSEITIDGSTMKYWYGDEEPQASSQIALVDGYAESTGTAGLRRYRYHGGTADWSYDVFFEVLSYAYDGNGDVTGVEIVAYRVLTR